MNDEVKVCVDAKVNFLDNYFDIPDTLIDEVASLKTEIDILGEQSMNATEFEEKFVSSGLNSRFNNIVQKCPQKTHKMTKEEKQHSKSVAKEIFNDNKKDIARDAVLGTADRAVNHFKDDMIAESREKMIEDGVYNEYGSTRGEILKAESVLGFFKKKLKK